MRGKRVVIEMQPGRFDVAVTSGDEVVDGRRLRVPVEPDATAWMRLVRGRAGELRAAVDALRAAGAPATVLYRSPTQAADLVDFELRSSGQATEAALLRLGDTLPYSFESAVIQADVVGRDRGGAAPRRHVVVAADRNDVLAAIAELVEAAGLRLDAAVPLDAALIARLATTMLGSSDWQHGRLYVGEHTSMFFVAGSGSLQFGRPIRLGLDHLAQALTRPIREADGSTRALPVEVARSILDEHGLPRDDCEALRRAHGLTRAQLMPLLQPVLQRFVIELRQSLRFGLGDEQREQTTITLCGPGSAMRGLGALLEAELGVPVSADPAYERYAADDVGGPGSELRDALRGRRAIPGIGLLPRRLGAARRSGRLRRWLVTGAAAAVAVIGVDGWRYHVAVRDAETRLEVLARRSAQVETLVATRDELLAAMGDLGALDRAVRAETGAAANFRALLQELSRVAPTGIELTNVAFDRREGRTIGTVGGFALSGAADDHAVSLQHFVRALRSSPLFDEAIIDGVQMGAASDGPRRRFTLTLAAVDAPRSGPGATLARTGEEAP